MEIVAFDESGNTGEDLLNPEQPLFALASVCLSDSVAAEIIEPLRSSQSKELHFKKLKDSSRGQEKILQLLSHPALAGESVKLSATLKSFFLTTKLVDLLIEPTMRLYRNHDLYRDGENIALANMFAIVIGGGPHRERFEQMQRRFLSMMRRRQVYEIDKFYQVVQSFYRALMGSDCKSACFLLPIMKSQTVVQQVLEYSDPGMMDPIVPAYVELVNAWGEQLGRRFDVLFDESKTIEKNRTVLAAISHQDESDTIIGYDRRKVTFPLKVNSLRLADSKSHLQLQVADIVGSSYAYCTREKNRGNAGKFVTAIEAAFIAKKFPIFWSAPTLQFTPEELGTVTKAEEIPMAAVSDILRRRLPP